ncbi:hypothetical protein [Actinoplanes sp. NPDC089786]|uniref:hypothetical protein n=1 Tax=Actinoplanes sp. NPDC089786 TaxID=3155185 RepID=UPI00341C1B03
MTIEIREINIEKGWRTAGGGLGNNTFGDYLALLHSELSEALEAYRDHRLADATDYDNGDPCADPVGHKHKPEGVGSEFADVLIRVLDTCDVCGVQPFENDLALADVSPIDGRYLQSFGDWIAWLHLLTAQLGSNKLADDAAYLLRALVATCEQFGIDLTAEYERKITYNRTRTYQHGGRTLVA